MQAQFETHSETSREYKLRQRVAHEAYKAAIKGGFKVTKLKSGGSLFNSGKYTKFNNGI